jgi:hypothetical protein
MSKEFEEWLDTLSYFERECQSPSFYGGLEGGWKAAFINIQQWLMGRRCTENDVLDYVNKELNDV